MGGPTLHCTQSFPTGTPSTYLLIHQFRLHLARQPGARRVQVEGGCIRVSKLWEQKLALCGAVLGFWEIPQKADQSCGSRDPLGFCP